MEIEILQMYFEEKMKQVDIALKLGITKYRVSRVVTKDERYQSEKSNRKQKSKENHIKNTKKIIKNQREKIKFKNNSDDLILKRMHNQASMELSKGKKLSDISYLKWNKSAYKFNSEKNRFEFREELGRSYDVKKYLKGTI